MIRLNRTTEYALMALRHMSRKASSCVTSAREIADAYGLPFEITAKTLQRLKDTGLIQSAHGAKGGYTLERPLDEISLGQFLELMEGPQTLVLCASSADTHASETLRQSPVSPILPSECECEYSSRCEIHDFMREVNARILTFLSGIRLTELAKFKDQFGRVEPLQFMTPQVEAKGRD